MKGRDLLSEVRLKPDTTDGGSGRVERSGGVRLQPDLYSETEYPRVAGWSPLQALTDGRWMTIRAGSSTTPGAPAPRTTEVYDLTSDPQQLQNLATAQRSIATAMSARIDAIRASAGAAATREISPQAAERLRALGYVAGTASGESRPASATVANPATMIAVWNRFEDALSALNAHRADALGLIEPLAREHPESLVFQTTAARAVKDAGHAAEALAIYRSAARRWPTDAPLLHDLAVAARDGAQTATGAAALALREEAATAERAAIALDPNSATAHNGLGLVAIDEGRPKDAAIEFERAAAIDPNNASYAANLGNARRASGDRAGAEQAYRRALEIDPRAAEAANGLGVLFVEAHRAAEAIPWFERALTAAPDFVEARLNLGIARQEAGDTRGAAAMYREVLKAPPRFARERGAAAKLLTALESAR